MITTAKLDVLSDLEGNVSRSVRDILHKELFQGPENSSRAIAEASLTAASMTRAIMTIACHAATNQPIINILSILGAVSAELATQACSTIEDIRKSPNGLQEDTAVRRKMLRRKDDSN